MFNIRDIDMRVVRRAPTLAMALRHPSKVERIDIWRKVPKEGPGTVLVGITWADGASAIAGIAVAAALDADIVITELRRTSALVTKEH